MVTPCCSCLSRLILFTQYRPTTTIKPKMDALPSKAGGHLSDLLLPTTDGRNVDCTKTNLRRFPPARKPDPGVVIFLLWQVSKWWGAGGEEEGQQLASGIPGSSNVVTPIKPYETHQLSSFYPEYRLTTTAKTEEVSDQSCCR